MAIRQTEAFLIRTYPLSESSMICVFYTKDFGKVRAVARGVRNTKSKFRGQLDLLNRGELIYNEKANRELQSVREFDLIDNFDRIKANFNLFTYACYFSELVDAMESDGADNPDVFLLLTHTFRSLQKMTDLRLFARAFELQLLQISGYAPDFTRCGTCGRSFTVNDVNLHYYDQSGEIVCTSCSTPQLVSLSRGSCELMRRIQETNFDRLKRIRTSQRNQKEMRFVLSSLISFHTHRRLKSLEFLDLVEKDKW